MAKSKEVSNWRGKVASSVAKRKNTMAKLPNEGGNFVTFRGGRIRIGGVDQPNPLPTIVLAHQYQRVYFSGAFVEGDHATPACYSYDGETPHQDAETPEHTACNTCPMNKFGTGQQGRGKGCKEGVKLAMIVGTKPDAQVVSSPIMRGSISFMNSKIWKKYVSELDDQGVALWQVGTMISNAQDDVTQYKVGFKTVPLKADDDMMDILSQREEEAMEMLLQPYPKLEQAPDPAVKKRRKF